MNTIEIIKNAENLTFNQRWTYMIELGVKSKNNEDLTKALL